MRRKDVKTLLELPLAQLVTLANLTRKDSVGDKLELCSIMNAKSGLCGQDCKFCAQSARYHSNAPIFPLKNKEEMFLLARRAKKIGAERFDIVTSGERLSKDELKIVAEVIFEITAKLKIKMCASLGAMDAAGFGLLKEAGLTRYHHNLEASPRFFPRIVTTHTFRERVATIIAAKNTGLEVCSGGIIGMGEGMDDRIDLALWLRKLKVDSVPINILVPIKGTPLEGQKPLSREEAIKTIAIFRLILKDKIIKVAAGRESVFGGTQISPFQAGANGMLIGGYLTIKGQALEQDQALAEQIRESWSR
jgi:biotin synthase